MLTTATTIDPEQQMLREVEMVGRDRWEEIHRRAGAGGSIRAIARELDLDRKTVRRCLRQRAVEAVPAFGAGGHAAGPARGVCAAEVRRRSATRRRFCSKSSRQPAVPRQLRDGEAVRAAVAGDAVARGGDADAI